MHWIGERVSFVGGSGRQQMLSGGAFTRRAHPRSTTMSHAIVQASDFGRLGAPNIFKRNPASLGQPDLVPGRTHSPRHITRPSAPS